ncbi:MAG: HAD family hydrolase [Alphaproteobacteria bacterium]|nr:HAD family hydrolase [Alphaproteobacteria bacterium]
MIYADIGCIIWDCDGCLIDSELLACGISAQLLTELGYSITAQGYIDRFAGQGIRHSIRIIEDETGLPFMERFPFSRLYQERELLFRANLKPIDGIKEVLDVLELPMCIASGSEPDRLTLTLEITGLYEKFVGRIYSATQVAHGKPAPDLFLYAAHEMGVEPNRCLVVEDSANGIMAAQAAGMPVLGFLGGSHASEAWGKKLKETGVEFLFDDMRDLPKILAY